MPASLAGSLVIVLLPVLAVTTIGCLIGLGILLARGFFLWLHDDDPNAFTVLR